MEANTRMMLQLAGLLAENSQPKADDQPNANQVLIAELAKQILINASSKALSGTAIQHKHIISNTLQPSPNNQTFATMNNNCQLSNGMVMERDIATREQEPTRRMVSTNMQNTHIYKTSTGPTALSNNELAQTIIQNTPKLIGHSAARPQGNLTSSQMMFAMRMIKMKNRKKRGPKEKQTFRNYMYCLPDKFARLPKFSSPDPLERNLVRQHQLHGYGYPAQDYIDSVPRKTNICLAYSAEKFRNFIITLFPNLESLQWDMYRIDKQRRLIRVEANTPREIKNMRYQGSLIIIPYERDIDRPTAVLHRNGDDLFAIPTFTDVSCSVVREDEEFELDNSEMKAEHHTIHIYSPQQTMSLPTVTSSPTQVTNECDSISAYEDTSEREITTDEQESSTGTGIYDPFPALSSLRLQLADTVRIHFRLDSIISEVLHTYRQNPTIMTHNIAVCFTDHTADSCAPHDDKSPGTMFVPFWEAVFAKFFQGDLELVPMLDPDLEDDTFRLLGKILLHGLILSDYWPTRLSQACASVILTGTCSDEQLLGSLKLVMSDNEWNVIDTAKQEARFEQGSFSVPVTMHLSSVLGSYGSKQIPSPSSLENHLQKLARNFMIHQKYWALQEMRSGMLASGVRLADAISENCVASWYDRITPNALTMFERIIYLFSNDEMQSGLEKLVKVYFERYIMKLNRDRLCKLLFLWCDYDCLCVEDLYVKFTTCSGGSCIRFDHRQAVVTLASFYTSQEELFQLLDRQVNHAFQNPPS